MRNPIPKKRNKPHIPIQEIDPLPKPFAEFTGRRFLGPGPPHPIPLPASELAEESHCTEASEAEGDEGVGLRRGGRALGRTGRNRLPPLERCQWNEVDFMWFRTTEFPSEYGGLKQMSNLKARPFRTCEFDFASHQQVDYVSLSVSLFLHIYVCTGPL